MIKQLKPAVALLAGLLFFAGCGRTATDAEENSDEIIEPNLLYGIPAVKGVEFGAGFDVACMRGSENNDAFYYDGNGLVRTKTNNAGGILGGITTGMPILFRIAVKPTPSIGREQHTVDLTTKTIEVDWDAGF